MRQFFLNYKKLIIIIASIIAGAGIIAASYFFFIKPRQVNLISPNAEPSPTPLLDERAIPTTNAEIAVPTPDTSTADIATTRKLGVLLLGYGGAGHEGGYLSDVIQVAYINFDTNTIGLIHIPRDLYVSIPTTTTPIKTKVNAALAMGTKSGNYPTKSLTSDVVLRGAYVSRDVVEKITGIKISYVVGIDFNSFVGAINALRSIPVKVTTTFDDPWYPIKGRELELCGHSPEDVTAMSATMSGFNLEKQFPCRYEHLHFDPGTTQMDGDTALKYSRSRHSTSDFSRGERQATVLAGIKDKLFSLNALDKIPEFFKALSKVVKTDITLEALTGGATKLKLLSTYKVVQVGLSTANVLQSGTSPAGASILIPKAGEDNYSEIQQFITSKLQP
jgi:anionic cell wall polymer biosynthesis LytR-Cps2A-Psr (LCP) family protein